MIKKALHKMRWNKIAGKLAKNRVAIRGRNLSQEEELALCERIAKKKIEYLKISSDDNVLDIGCSEGYFTREFARHSSQVWGIDFAPKMIEVAIYKGKGITNVSYKVASITDLPFKNGFFTKINCFSVIQYLENFNEVQKAFDEIARVLVRGGIAYIGDVYFDKKELLKIIYKQEVRNNLRLARIGYLINLFIFTVFPPILFFSKEELYQFGENSGLKTVFCRKTIDEPYEDIGMDILFCKL